MTEQDAPPVSLIPSVTFGSRLRNLREARDLTQKQLAAMLDIDHTYVCKLETDHEE